VVLVVGVVHWAVGAFQDQSVLCGCADCADAQVVGEHVLDVDQSAVGRAVDGVKDLPWRDGEFAAGLCQLAAELEQSALRLEGKPNRHHASTSERELRTFTR
jgi:hypothetical protein